DFSVIANESVLPFKKDVRAFLGEKDITDTLLRSGVPPDVYPEPDKVGYLGRAIMDELVKIGAFSRSYQAETEGAICCYYAEWIVRVTYYWTQLFPPGQSHVHHEYKPVKGFMVINGVQELLEQCSDGCIRKDMVDAMMAERQENGRGGYSSFRVEWIDYILKTANSWDGPIKTFDLFVEMKNPGDMLSFCWDSPLERVSDKVFHTRKEDFVPDRDLRLYFL
ncbi:MAG: DUF4424 family protein, partial [Thermodesulfobacteriota bacterium]